MSNVVAVGDANFESEVLQSPNPVLVDFYAIWCGPCRMVAPLVDELAATFEGRLKVVKCDVDQYEALSLRYGVSKIPNLSFFKDGEVVAQVVGYTNRRELTAYANEVLGT